MFPPKESDLTINSFLIPRNRVFCGLIRLKPSIFDKCYYASVFHFFILGFILTTTEILQKRLLKYAPNYLLNGDDESLIKAMNNLYIADLISRVFFFPIYGFLIDKTGRRKMNVFAFITIALSFSLFPICGSCALFNSISPWLYFVRIIYASGTSVLILMPFIGDYVEIETKGRALSLNILIFSIGMALATVGATNVYTSENPMYIHLAMAPIILIIGTLYSLCLKAGSFYYRTSIKQIVPTSIESKKRRIDPIQIILRTLKRRPWVRTGFILSIFGGMNLGTLYQTKDPYNNYSKGNNGPENYIVLHPYTFLIGVIATLVVHILMDFIELIYVIYIVIVLEIACFICGLVIDDPSPELVFVFFSSIFAICLSCIAILCYIESRYCPRIVRGYSNGFKMACFTLSALITLVIVRFASTKEAFSFLLAFSVLGLILFTVDYYVAIKKWEIKYDRRRGTGIKTLLSIEGLDPDLLEESGIEKSLIENLRLETS